MASWAKAADDNVAMATNPKIRKDDKDGIGRSFPSELEFSGFQARCIFPYGV
jgi:hypothetical protein